MPYIPNHFTGWYHCIIRFNRNVLVDDEIIRGLVNKFQVIRSRHPFLIVHHGYGSGDEGVSHTHFLYKHYKQCQKTHIIRSWAEDLGAKEYFRLAGYPQLLREYLVSGGGRSVVHQVEGGGFPPTSDSEHDPKQSWAEEAEIICKPDSWECIDPASGGSGRKATSDRLARNSRGIYGRDQIYDLAERLRILLNKYPSKDQPALFRRIPVDSEDMGWFKNAMNHPMFDKTFANEINTIKMELKAKGYMHSCSLLPDDPSEYVITTMTINQSLWWLRETLRRNNVDPVKFTTDVIQIMTLNNGKRNCLYLQGIPDGGKTTIEQSITAGFFSSTTLSLLTDNTSAFAFEDLVRAGVCVFNEPAIAGKQVELAKLILEGNPFSAEVKYKQKEEVVKLPVIVTTNRDIWVYAYHAETAIRARICDYYFTVKAPPRTKPLHPKVWLKLAEYYGLPKCEMSRNTENEIDISEFATVPEHNQAVQASPSDHRPQPEMCISPSIRDRSHDTTSEEDFSGQEEESDETNYSDFEVGEIQSSSSPLPIRRGKRLHEVRILSIIYYLIVGI